MFSVFWLIFSPEMRYQLVWAINIMCCGIVGAIDKGGEEGPNRVCSGSRRGGGKGELTTIMGFIVQVLNK